MKKKKQGVPAAVKKQSFKAYMKGHYDLYLLLREYPKVCVNLQTDVR